MELARPRVWFGLTAALYVIIFPWHPGLRSPNELCRLWQTRAIVEHGKLSLNETMQKYGQVGDLSVVDGVFYPSKAPLMSFAAVPIYWVMTQVSGTRGVPELPQVFFSRLFLTIAPTLLMLLFLLRFLKVYLSGTLPEVLVVAYALGTIAFSYSEAFFSHQATAVLLFLAFYAAWRTLRGELKTHGWVIAGALAGAAVMAEYTAALTVVCLAVYVAVSLVSGTTERGQRDAALKRLAVAAGLVLLGAAPFLGALMAYHQACFGHPLESGYKHLADAGYQPWHLGGFLGIRYPDPRAFALSFFSPLRGLFMLSPFLLFALVGLKTLRTGERPLFWFTVVLLALNAYFTSSFTYDSWGWTTGPRHMTPLIPFLLLPVGLALHRLSASPTLDGRIGYSLAVGLIVSSVLVVGCVVFVNYVPDSLSTSVFGLALPLFAKGYLPPTVLNFFGLANPVAGVVPFLLLFAAAALLVRALVDTPQIAAAAAAAALGHLLLLSAATRHDASDQGAVGHLTSVWLAPPGQTPEFW